MCKRGKLIFRHATMNSGKSLHLLASAHNFEERGIPVLVLKPSIDTRDGDSVIFSRALGKRTCKTIYPNDNILYMVRDKYVLKEKAPKWILIDECQFLEVNQVDELAALADMYGINVICYGLRTDFQTHLFPASKRLFEIADTIEEMKASCDCEYKTLFNARIDVNGNVVTEGNQVEVGGEDKYVALCRKCYNERINNPYYKKN